jgi:hypothetical protein
LVDIVITISGGKSVLFTTLTRAAAGREFLGLLENTETRAAPIPEYLVRLGFAPVLYFFTNPPEYNMKRLFAPFLLVAGAMLLSVASYGQAINSVPYTITRPGQAPVGTFVTLNAP